MREPLLVYLQLEKFSTFPKTKKDFIAIVLFIYFLIYIVSVGKPTLMMILNQMMDILW